MTLERNTLTTPDGALAPDDAARQRLIGIGLMCAALVCFACLDATAKWLNRNQDPLLTVWARYAVSVALVFLVLNPWTAPGLTRTQRFWLQIGRSMLLLLSTVLNFFALQHLQLAQTISIQFATPFLVALLAGPILGEWIGPRRFAAIAVGFLGVLVVARPGSTHPAMLLTMAGTVCYALYGIATRILAAHDSSRTTLFYSGLVGVAVMMPLLPWIWRTPPDALTWAGMIAVGALGGFGHWLLILAHARAPAAILSPFIYTQLAWMILLGYLVFGDVPDRWTLIGAGIVVASGLYLLSRERVRKVEPSTPT
ncbi:MAG TPA: DMT family transporter [Beijerinckiaceae bacterium]|jgi:drug/metabolite transporter (DMT)-like permease